MVRLKDATKKMSPSGSTLRHTCRRNKGAGVRFGCALPHSITPGWSQPPRSGGGLCGDQAENQPPHRRGCRLTLADCWSASYNPHHSMWHVALRHGASPKLCMSSACWPPCWACPPTPHPPGPNPTPYPPTHLQLRRRLPALIGHSGELRTLPPPRATALLQVVRVLLAQGGRRLERHLQHPTLPAGGRGALLPPARRPSRRAAALLLQLALAQHLVGRLALAAAAAGSWARRLLRV